ncbi:hypothetical protein GGI11_001559 [Coemansia sp. RSA 2049]|nr:hypothetical protein GGI11_001559 [Coemansia sp. RSA 2049]
MRLRIILCTDEHVQVHINNINRREKVEDVRVKAAQALEAECGKPFDPERLSFIFSGKQLANGMELFHYDVRHDDSLLTYVRLAADALDDAVLDDNAMTVDSASKVKDVVPNSPSIASTSTMEVSPSADRNLNRADEKALASDAGLAGSKEEPEEVVKCDHCDNTIQSNCKHCGCYYCGLKDDEEHTLACDECGSFFHMRCLPEPLDKIPEGDWYCELCKNDHTGIIVGEQKLDLTKGRKAKMPSAKQTRNWGGGMACVGTTKTCNIVSKDHVGPIPGVRVGQLWRYRINVSESGIHRPPVAGISGSSTKPAVSIVLAGGYPEDTDCGEEFIYTGSGGYDLSGNKRMAKVQTFDQELTRQNRSLALACAAPVDEKNGGKANDWKQSSPIRVCRSFKIAKLHPKFAPKEGVRYDGLYRIVKYWKEKGVSGFYVWRYLFRRDDPEAAPWTEEGKANILRLGIRMIGEDMDTAKNSASKRKRAGEATGGKGGRAAKGGSNGSRYIFKPTPELLELIRLDKDNVRLWSNMADSQYESETAYLEALTENMLVCPICQELTQRPCTTSCGHNICYACLQSSMKSFGVLCPMCRGDISDMSDVDLKKRLNQNLVNVLQALIPSYGKDWKEPVVATKLQRARRSGKTVSATA